MTRSGPISAGWRYSVIAVGSALCFAAMLSGEALAEEKPAAEHPGPHWTYSGEEGPARWGELQHEGKVAFPLCSAGKAQSPIDLGPANAIANVAVSTNYKTGKLQLNKNSHTVEVKAPPGSTMTSGGRVFNLDQVHFHAPSEHKIGGKQYPLEAHFVHHDEQGQLAVLAVLFEIGTPNPQMTAIYTQRQSENYSAGPHDFDPSKLLPSPLRVYRYMGSLTTPPCSEGVHWHVAAQPLTVNSSQVGIIKRFVGSANARPVQELNARLLVKPQ